MKSIKQIREEIGISLRFASQKTGIGHSTIASFEASSLNHSRFLEYLFFLKEQGKITDCEFLKMLKRYKTKKK
jgi:transcriptional regulator with XRE-family HTH domain